LFCLGGKIELINILVVHGHWYNRGDEAAIRAMVDEIQRRIPDSKITMQILAAKHVGMESFVQNNVNILDNYFPRKRDFLEWFIMYVTKGKLAWSSDAKKFLAEVKEADIVIHAPGGPSIGDIYSKAEWSYFERFLLFKRLEKKYYFYAPSMGPFCNKFRNIIRKYILKNAVGIVFREEISGLNFSRLLPDKEYKVTLDSAFQNSVDFVSNQKIFDRYDRLKEFLKNNDKVIGITITDLQWNGLYQGNIEIKNKIDDSFNKLLDYLIANGYAVVFIPQLFGEQNDYNYMNSFSRTGTFIVDDSYDCYFQQYLISKLTAVIGMRYHSNIFSCKLGIPFVSISYEQKMKGFMEKVDLKQYCIDVNQIDDNVLIEKFKLMIHNYDTYREYLQKIREDLRKKSAETTDYLIEIIG